MPKTEIYKLKSSKVFYILSSLANAFFLTGALIKFPSVVEAISLNKNINCHDYGECFGGAITELIYFLILFPLTFIVLTSVSHHLLKKGISIKKLAMIHIVIYLFSLSVWYLYAKQAALFL